MQRFPLADTAKRCNHPQLLAPRRGVSLLPVVYRLRAHADQLPVIRRGYAESVALRFEPFGHESKLRTRSIGRSGRRSIARAALQQRDLTLERCDLPLQRRDVSSILRRRLLCRLQLIANLTPRKPDNFLFQQTRNVWHYGSSLFMMDGITLF